MNGIPGLLVLGALAALANLVGGLLIASSGAYRSEAKLLKYLVALGAGFMLAAIFIEIVPETVALWTSEARGADAAKAVVGAFTLLLGGYLLIQLFEHTIAPHFHFGEETHADEFLHAHKGYSVVIGLVIHTFFDGIAIASGFLVSNWLGWIIFVAIFLHKIPEGFTVASVMLASGQSRKIAWGASALLGAATFAGVLTMALFRQEVGFGLPLSAGVTIYVAASDLIPEVNREPGVKMALVVFLGVGFLFLLDHVAHVH